MSSAGAAVSGGKDPSPQYSEDLMQQFELGEVLNEMRKRKLRSSFMHYISEISTDTVPLKPRCPAGSLMEIAMQPVNEDERRLELFDERVLRNALTLKEVEGSVSMPEWLEVEQAWDKKKKEKRKKKKKKKRKRGGDEDEDEERGRKKKRK